MGHSRGTVTGHYIDTVDSLLVMAADTLARYIQGLLNGKRFRRTTYALDRALREAALHWRMSRRLGALRYVYTLREERVSVPGA